MLTIVKLLLKPSNEENRWRLENEWLLNLLKFSMLLLTKRLSVFLLVCEVKNNIVRSIFLRWWLRVIRCIFDGMSRQTGTKILFIFFFILVTSLGIKTVSRVPATIIETLKTETLSHQSEKGPHSELEGTHFNFSTTGHTVIQKTVAPFYLLPVSVFYNACISLENFQIKRSSLLIKDYLFHIYPTHNFW